MIKTTFLIWYRSLVLVLSSHIPVKFQSQSVTVTVLSKCTLETAESYLWIIFYVLKGSVRVQLSFLFWSYNTFKDDIQIYCRVKVINCFTLNVAAIKLVIIWYLLWFPKNLMITQNLAFVFICSSAFSVIWKDPILALFKCFTEQVTSILSGWRFQSAHNSTTPGGLWASCHFLLQWIGWDYWINQFLCRHVLKSWLQIFFFKCYCQGKIYSVD